MSNQSPTPAAPASPQSVTSPGGLSPLRLQSNRRNAQKSTGPRTQAGKYRSALNAELRRLMPEALERELRARGEDPRDFCRLHRDLVAIFRPRHVEISTAVMMLACAWWQKARRMRQWIGSGAPRSPELDSRIEALLLVIVGRMRAHNRQWQRALAAAVGEPVGDPADVRRQIERRLALFGAKPVTRKRSQSAGQEPERDRESYDAAHRERIETCIETLVKEIIAEEGNTRSSKAAVQEAASVAGAGEAAGRANPANPTGLS